MALLIASTSVRIWHKKASPSLVQHTKEPKSKLIPTQKGAESSLLLKTTVSWLIYDYQHER